MAYSDRSLDILRHSDPYHSLNFGPYGTEAPGSKEELDPSYSEKRRNARFLKDVGLSYLRHDVEGRVIRIDTFSKTIVRFFLLPQIALASTRLDA
jgi:hypothetical protein